MSLYADILRIGYHAVMQSGGTISRSQGAVPFARVTPEAVKLLVDGNAKLKRMEFSVVSK